MEPAHVKRVSALKSLKHAAKEQTPECAHNNAKSWHSSKWQYTITLLANPLIHPIHIFYTPRIPLYDSCLSITSLTFSLTPCFPPYFSSNLSTASSALLPLISLRISSSLGNPIHLCGYSV
jgi:hypothetical protein